MNQQQRQAYESIASFLWRSLVLGYLVLIVWTIALLWPGSLLCQLHQNLFDLSLHECNIVLYGGLGLMKILLIVFYLLPWLAIRWLLKRS